MLSTILVLPAITTAVRLPQKTMNFRPLCGILTGNIWHIPPF